MFPFKLTLILSWYFDEFIELILDYVQNESLQLCMKITGSTGARVEHAVFQQLSSDAEILGEVISHGQMNIEKVVLGSVVLILRPLTDQAVQTLLDAKTNNNLAQMIFAMLSKIDIKKMMDTAEPLEIRVQVLYSESAKPKPCKFFLLIISALFKIQLFSGSK